jgi:gluconate 5-dehydrogenase
MMTDYRELFDLKNRCAVVIGGGGGIGGAIAEGLAAVGANVVIVGRSLEKLRAQVGRIREKIGVQPRCLAADCSDEGSVAKLYDEVLATLGGADILVNSQGVNKKFSALEHPVAEWDEMFAANVKSVMLTCKYFGRHMKEQRYGRIVNLSSINSIRAKQNDFSVCYGATKGAINAYSMNLAAGWAEFGITVNCIGPIIVETEMMRPILEQNPEMRASTIAGVPMGRLCKVEDCAGIAIFFASDAAAFLTGQVLYPDGGVSIRQ